MNAILDRFRLPAVAIIRMFDQRDNKEIIKN